MPFFVVFDYKGGRGVGGNAKRLRSFFISYDFFGVFQNDPGPPKYALEFRDYVKGPFIFLKPSLIMILMNNMAGRKHVLLRNANL